MIKHPKTNGSWSPDAGRRAGPRHREAHVLDRDTSGHEPANRQRSLTQARSNELLCTEAYGKLRRSTESVANQAITDGFPQGKTRSIVRIVGVEQNDVRRPARRHRYPIRLLEEEGLGQNATADLEIAPIVWIGPAIACYSGAHLLQGMRPVRLSECFPGKGTGQRIGVSEDTPANDYIARGVQLEKEQLARLHSYDEVYGHRQSLVACADVVKIGQSSLSNMSCGTLPCSSKAA